MRKTMILLGFLALAPFAKGQLLLEALEGGIPFTPSEKCLELVKDKHYGDGVHNFIYCAVKGPDGKIWLNNNLGAEYANENSPYFDPTKQAETPTDTKAFGSLFQYARDADGHELVKWIDSTRGELVMDVPRLGLEYRADYTISNDPCPDGFITPRRSSFENWGLSTSYSSSNMIGSLRIPTVPYYLPHTNVFANDYFQYWLSEPVNYDWFGYTRDVFWAWDYHLQPHNGTHIVGSHIAIMQPIRCVSNK